MAIMNLVTPNAAATQKLSCSLVCGTSKSDKQQKQSVIVFIAMGVMILVTPKV
jgi:hypothetical protein